MAADEASPPDSGCRSPAPAARARQIGSGKTASRINLLLETELFYEIFIFFCNGLILYEFFTIIYIDGVFSVKFLGRANEKVFCICMAFAVIAVFSP